MVGKTIAHYKIQQELDKSGMGMVYKAQDTRLNRSVVLKLFPNVSLSNSDPDDIILNEARAASALNHPNIVTIYDIGEEDGISFIAMEYINGKSLRDLLKIGQLSIKDALKIAIDICESICIAHCHDITHLDVKPENIMQTDTGIVKILDFGLAKFKKSKIKANKSAISGTIAYMSPERFQGEIGDNQSDIFSIGVIIYEMVTGTHPFHDKHHAAITYNILNVIPIPPQTINPLIPDKLNLIIEKSIQKDKRLRYNTSAELISDLYETLNELNSVKEQADKGSQITSIAVLPFSNIGKKDNHDYIGEGIAEDLINELSKIDKLNVVSRISSFKYKGEQDDIISIGKELNVNALLKGSIQKLGNHLRIIIQLIRIKDGYLLWSEKFDNDFEDVFKIIDTITSNIINSLRLLISKFETDSEEKNQTVIAEAYDYYLRGRSYFRQIRRSGIESAIEMFTAAIKIDSNYTLAYAGLADCYSFIHLYWNGDDAIAEKALQAGTKAVKLDDKLAEAQVAYGLANSLINNYEKSEIAFNTAIALNPQLFEAYYFNAIVKFSQGKVNNAIYLYEKACQVQPDDFLSPYFLANIYRSQGREMDAKLFFNKCVKNAEKQLHINPTNVRALYIGAGALVHLGEKSRGLDWAKQALKIDPNEPSIFYNVACIFATAGMLDDGIEYLDQAVEAGFAKKDWIMHDSDLDPLRDSPKFEAILEKL